MKNIASCVKKEVSEQIIVQKVGCENTYMSQPTVSARFCFHNKTLCLWVSEEFFKSCTGENVISTAKLLNWSFSQFLHQRH